ncbi:MAG TPA: hypothetical protein VGV15_18620 [Terriglobales bacterium]|nr:hypothetical protein [Terriglobales bacterium]
MKLRIFVVLGTISLVFIALGSAAPTKEKEPAGQKVDSGSFGVFVNGRRVATETFSIVQNNNGSVANSQFKTEPGADSAAQSSQLELSVNGDLRRYEWKELSPGKAQALVLPNDNLLIERSSSTPQDKQEEHPFLLPTSTSILDDYFFIHREILAWKYLATSCRQDKGQLSCPVHQRAQFGALNPHSRSSMLVSLEFADKEKASIHGVERELYRLNLKSESGDWQIWLDDQFKLLRILVTADKTEVVRD